MLTVLLVEQNWEMENLKLRVLGAHQQDNALTAVSTVLALRSQGMCMLVLLHLWALCGHSS